MPLSDQSCDRAAPPPRRRFLRRFRRNESGATAVEMALVATPFFAILFAIIQLGYRFFAAEALDTAVAEASRAIMTGQVQSNVAITTADQFRDQVLCNTTKRLLPEFMDCSKLVVDVRQLSSFGDASFSTSGADLLTGSPTTYSPGARGAIVVARAAYPLSAVAPQLTGGGATMIGGELQYALLGVFVFRNEPF